MATSKSNSKNKKKKSGSMFGFAIVVLALMVISIVFLVKKDQIFTNYKETSFFDRVFGSTPQFVASHETPAKTEDVPVKDEPITIQIKEEPKKIKVPVDIQPPKVEEAAEIKKTASQDAAIAKDSQKQETSKAQEKKAPESDFASAPAKAPEPAKTATAPVATTDLSLCFVLIDSDGSVVRKIVKRSVPKNNSPLVTSINLLLGGPDYSAKAEKNNISFIPKGTKLLGASVKNGVATLNFSDELQYNNEGTVGLRYSLMQIVYTATSFSTVNSVQFLIEGQKMEYLGEEGIWIGSPLSKNSF